MPAFADSKKHTEGFLAKQIGSLNRWFLLKWNIRLTVMTERETGKSIHQSKKYMDRVSKDNLAHQEGQSSTISPKVM
jgi:hypothetical protein